MKKENELQKKKIEDLQTKLNEKESNFSSKSNKQSLDPSKEMKIMKVDELDKIKKAGKIGYVSMAKVLKVSREEIYAMKIIKIEFCQKDDNDEIEDNISIDFDKAKRFFQEYEIMNQFKHPITKENLLDFDLVIRSTNLSFYLNFVHSI